MCWKTLPLLLRLNRLCWKIVADKEEEEEEAEMQARFSDWQRALETGE